MAAWGRRRRPGGHAVHSTPRELRRRLVYHNIAKGRSLMESYIVRIYQRDNERLVGVLETFRKNKRPFRPDPAVLTA
jgi:hypothetical protein